MTTFLLAFESIGVLYGDFRTSPMYVFASTFHEGIEHKDDILYVLSMIFTPFWQSHLLNTFLLFLRLVTMAMVR